MPIPSHLFLCKHRGSASSYWGNRVPLETTCVPLAKAQLDGNNKGQLSKSGDGAADPWAEFTRAFRAADQPLPGHWSEIFGPLRAGTVDSLMVIGQTGQSLDGRIATDSGHSRYINGPAGVAHLHRLRSLVDAVVIGVGTALADDPQLTVRHVTGPNPVRIVLDPNGRLASIAKVFAADGIRRIVVTAEGTRYTPPPDVEVVALPVTDGLIAPTAILAALAERGLHRILIEGGADTVSRFLTAGCFDRLHVTVAPVIFGSGRPGFVLPPVERADQALRAPMRIHQLDDEVLFDCDLSAQRIPVGRAKTST
jgi:diaminohydroxyphosphoribosylaminopyrimidine deaminase / 5-amino-6-(5-phosphoribosylamino)uracil reductase